MADIKLTGDWGTFGQVLIALSRPKSYDPEVKRCLLASGEMVRGEIRKRIADKKYAPNRPMTVALKGSDVPLVDKGDLYRAIAVKKPIEKREVFIGVLRTAKKGRRKLANVAAILHYWRGPIKVTPKMRRYFLAMSIKFPGKWFPLKPDTKFLSFTRRPFITDVTDDTKVIDVFKENCLKVMDAIINERPGRYRGRV